MPRLGLAGCSVLVLEDEFVIAMDLEDLLLGWRCDPVVVTKNCAEAEAALENGLKVDVVVADYNLGSETSEPLIARLRSKGVAVVLLTGQSLENRVLERMGGPRVLQKPVQPELLQRTLAEMVATAG